MCRTGHPGLPVEDELGDIVRKTGNFCEHGHDLYRVVLELNRFGSNNSVVKLAHKMELYRLHG